MTVSIFIALVNATCQLNDKVINYETKVACIEHYTNCMVGENGKIMSDKYEYCKDRLTSN